MSYMKDMSIRIISDSITKRPCMHDCGGVISFKLERKVHPQESTTGKLTIIKHNACLHLRFCFSRFERTGIEITLVLSI